MLSLKNRLIAIIAALLLALTWGCDSGDEEESDEATEAAQDQESNGDSEESDADDEESETSESETSEEREDSDEEDSRDDDDSDEGDEEESDDEGDEEDEDEESDDEEEASLDFDPTELPVYATGTVAVVEGEEITKDDFNIVAAHQLGMIPPEAIEAQGIRMSQIRDMILEGLVASVLINREIESRGIVISDAEIDEAIEQFEAMLAQQLGGEANLATMLQEQGVDEEVMREQVAQELAAERLLADGGSGSVSDAQVRQFYEENQSEFQTENMTRARHILLNVDNGNDDEMRQKAEELAGKLEADDSRFADLAAEHSACPSASQGGDLGYFTREMLMPEFTEVAFSLSPGELSEPVRSTLGWHVILVEDRVEEGVASFEEVRDQLRMMLEAQNMEQTAMQLIQRLRQEADVTIHEDNIVVDG